VENRWEGANVWGDEIGDDLVDVHFPECDGCVAVLRAYIDASTREDSGLLSVAAYMFESGRVRRFRQRWRDTFGADNFSWADLIARAEPFKNLRIEDGDSQHVRNQKNVEHKRLVSAAVEIIREHVIAGAIVSCWKQDVETFSPTWIKGFGHAYSIAGHITMAALGGWAKRNGYKGGIAYVIEAGDEGYDQLEHLLSSSSKAPLVADLY